jgi:hypothetical protein
MKPQSRKKIDGQVFFNREDIGSHQLVRLAESQPVEHICIDDDDRAHYLLMLKILNLGLIPVEIKEKIFGYKTESPLQTTYYYVNESQHQVLQSILDTGEVCEVINAEESNTEETA